MEIGRRLAANMKRLRRERGWSQEELAARAGLHRTFISQIERATKNPTLNVLEKVARALGVTVGKLVD
jgi:transcriptional regulator with XRE-family HTH domain